ncbi:hypothetical protein F4820DRAFT_232249 [Hypoxylon rubiginosum]|uniref:Uncharacterized protein n=1 Tax=Hypoxylon rubiginosum TaxID=110542 RepID=A0ACB9Z5C1_9PEZI|nr:hypothetical protein F4820DRAFT_232249 [Hypoxylon rubiginosum]
MGWFLGVAIGLAAIAVPSLIVGAGLGILGFGAAGIAKGTIAAGLHSAIGCASTPSIFATLQSAAMGGYGASIVSGVVQVVGGLVALVSAAFY